MLNNARNIALKVLYKIDTNNAYSNIALDETLKENSNKLNEKDIGLISQIVYGVTTWKLTLDEIIKKYSKIRLKKISPWIINILRMGAYQIIFLDKIPKSAAVNESVNLAKRYGHSASSGFVNAILRKISKDDYNELFNIENNIEKISKTTSMPIWIIEELLENNTIEEAQDICESLNFNPPLSIRINALKTTKEELKKIFEQKNIKYKEGTLNDFLYLYNVKNIENMEEFKNGLFTIQDESAGLSAIVLSPNENQNILDACSAPGGKTTYIAEQMKNSGSIEAWDIYEHRLKLVKENCQRLGIEIVATKEQDATKYDEKQNNKFDKILLDVPCLGIGVIKRKPDIKWQRKPSDIDEISSIQYEILSVCSNYLKEGGELVYSTCSILKKENEDVIEKFLNEHKEFSFANYAINEKSNIKSNKYINIKPNKEHDGFFICKLKKLNKK